MIELDGGKRLEEVRRDPNSDLVRGFTAWAVEGLERVYKNQDIFRADCIEAATEQFWNDTDPLTDFWESLSKKHLIEGMNKNLLRNLYLGFCDEEGIHPVGGHNWGARLQIGRIRRRKKSKRGKILGSKRPRINQIQEPKTRGRGKQREGKREGKNPIRRTRH